MWILTAKVVSKVVIRANKSNLNLNVVRSRRRSRKHELNIYSFFIHISNARFGIVIGAARCRKARAHKFRVMPLNLFPRTRFAQNPQFLTPAGSFRKLIAVTIWRFQNLAGPAYTKWNLKILPLWQPLAHIGIEIGLQGFRIWTEVRVRIKNLKTLAHVCFLLATQSSDFYAIHNTSAS